MDRYDLDLWDNKISYDGCSDYYYTFYVGEVNTICIVVGIMSGVPITEGCK